LAAVVTDASAGLRWLNAQPSNLPETRESLDRIVRNGRRAADVIGRIRALARRSPLQVDHLDMNEVVREVIALARAELDRNKVLLRIELDDGIPRIVGDRVQLQQVILNLIMNAIEAMRGDKRRELLVRSLAHESQNVQVSVADVGPGLDDASRDRVFDAFYTTKPDGTGMGLAISRSSVERHGGRIWATANQPHGAVFQFVVPGEQLALADAEYREIRPATP
jgi:signal transduction histidine kinase